MALTDKLTAIADAIRSKSGKSAAMTLDQMPVEIRALSAEEKIKASEYPAYVSPEVLEVANKVNSVRKSDSIVFVAMSDSHYPADQAASLTPSYGTKTVASTIQANQAAKVLAYLLDVDFFAHLGDVSAGETNTTPDMLKTQIEGFISYFREARSDLPVFICIGNHDSGIYYHDAHKDGNIHTMTGEYLYKNFTAHSESDNTVVGGRENGGYCYRDFPDKKLRVIMLNTSEQFTAKQIDNATFGAQRAWLGNALLDLNTKSDAAAWGFIVLCHYPADLGSSTMKISQLLGAYVNGNSITVTDSADGTNQTFNFSGKNTAKFYAHFHGHVHNFLHSRLYHTVNGSPVQYDAWRLCVPNGQVDRENTYGEILGINWREDKSYPKTPNTADGTSFVVNVINPSEEKIYSFCYGAGYDRQVSMGGFVYHSINKSLTLASITDESAVAVEDGESYSCKIVPNTDCTIESIVITMGGVDITSSAYNANTGVVSIAEVTGTVKITVVAKAPPVNLVTLATTTDGVTPFGEDYNGDGIADGYQKGMVLESGKETTGSNYAGQFSTGWIACNPKLQTLTLKNFDTTDGKYGVAMRIVTYTRMDITAGNERVDLKTLSTDGDGNIIVPTSAWKSSSGNYIRVSGTWMGSAPEIYAES